MKIWKDEGFDITVLFIVAVVIFSVVSSNKCTNGEAVPPVPEKDYYTKYEADSISMSLITAFGNSLVRADSINRSQDKNIYDVVEIQDGTIGVLQSLTTVVTASSMTDTIQNTKIENLWREFEKLKPPEYFIAEQLSDSVWHVIQWYIDEEDTATIVVYPYPVLKDTTYISWDANPDSEGVKVYRVFVKSAMGVDTIYVGPKTFKELLTKYLPYDELGFFIKAYDNAQNESAPSDTVKAIRKRN